MADAPAIGQAFEARTSERLPAAAGREEVSIRFDAAARLLVRHRWIVLLILSGSTVLCFVYWLLAPRQYEARARLALRTTPATSFQADSPQGAFSGSLASGQTQLETLAGLLRSDAIAWTVIEQQKLVEQPAFRDALHSAYPSSASTPASSQGQAILLEQFHRRLTVLTIPHTLLVEVRFRAENPLLAAEVVNGVVRACDEQETGTRLQATARASDWLTGQMKLMKAKADEDNRRLIAFQKRHGILNTQSAGSNGESVSVQHLPQLLEVDELARALAAAQAERIAREARYRVASQGGPELVLGSDRDVQQEAVPSISLLSQLRTRRSALEEEQAELDLEHGPNFPRVLEIAGEIRNIDAQIQEQDQKLLESFRRSWRAAADREQMLQGRLDQETRIGLGQNAAGVRYETLRRQADADQRVYLEMQTKAEEANLAAGVTSPPFWVVDTARPPARPSSPNLPLDLAVTLFAAGWAALAVVVFMESRLSRRLGMLVGALLVMAICSGLRAQAPTPSTSGLPTGVARIPQSRETRAIPNAKDAPPVWNGTKDGNGMVTNMPAGLAGILPAPIGPGDVLEIGESRTPEFRSTVRVGPAGTVALPMIGEVSLKGMDETAAARTVEKALVSGGFLRHPEVTVLVIASVGQDVTVLGEVARPGVYPYAAHHRLMDAIAASAGTTTAAGSVAHVYHRDDPTHPELIDMDSKGDSTDPARNPELRAGDTIQVSRSGLVYVVGDVIRPGGFTLEPGLEMTVLQAVSLAWGPTQNAALKKALLIREQGDERMVTKLDLKRILRGQDPDVPMGEHDILFVPDSAARNLWNRTMESIVQSTAGVSIYAGLVYSQRF